MGSYSVGGWTGSRGIVRRTAFGYWLARRPGENQPRGFATWRDAMEYATRSTDG